VRVVSHQFSVKDKKLNAEAQRSRDSEKSIDCWRANGGKGDGNSVIKQRLNLLRVQILHSLEQADDVSIFVQVYTLGGGMLGEAGHGLHLAA